MDALIWNLLCGKVEERREIGQHHGLELLFVKLLLLLFPIQTTKTPKQTKTTFYFWNSFLIPEWRWDAFSFFFIFSSERERKKEREIIILFFVRALLEMRENLFLLGVAMLDSEFRKWVPRRPVGNSEEESAAIGGLEVVHWKASD